VSCLHEGELKVLYLTATQDLAFIFRMPFRNAIMKNNKDFFLKKGGGKTFISELRLCPRNI
jgi:hypothetical protein